MEDHSQTSSIALDLGGGHGPEGAGAYTTMIAVRLVIQCPLSPFCVILPSECQEV